MKLSIGADEEQDVELDFSKATPVSIKTSPFDEAEILKSSSENGVFTFQYVNTFKKFSEGLAAKEWSGKWGFVDKNGTYGWIPENQIRRMEAIEDESRRLL